MKILYLAAVRLPTEKAHGVQIMKTCEALANKGVEVELVIPGRKTPIMEDAFEYYDVKRNFTITNLHTPDWVGQGAFGFALSLLWFSEAAKWRKSFWNADVIYSRDALVLAQYAFLGRTVIWESHDGVWNLWVWIVSKFTRAIVVVSEGLRDFYLEKGVPPGKVTVIRNGIDLSSFDAAESKESSRERLNIPDNLPIVMYVGALDGWKGTDTLLASTEFFKDKARLVVIGGSNEQITKLQSRYPDVLFLGFRPQKELADNLAAADVVVLPNTGKSEIATRFTSPLKLFAYMASGKPIIATDLPAARELIDEESAYLVKPDDPKALAHSIVEALNNPAEAERRGHNARTQIKGFSWHARAKNILQLLSEFKQ